MQTDNAVLTVKRIRNKRKKKSSLFFIGCCTVMEFTKLWLLFVYCKSYFEAWYRTAIECEVIVSESGSLVLHTNN